jgi:hypothetical protein
VPIFWFIWLSVLALGGLMLGVRLGRGHDRRAVFVLVVAVVLIALWSWLQRNPAVAVNAIPVWLLTHIEGAGAVPLFMLVTGVAWSRARKPAQKRLTILAAFFGGLFFLQGSMWMLQSTPHSVLGGTRGSGFTLQTQDYSCVPAACATALDRLGVHTTEAEMAELTQTRPGTGSTLIRALDGLTIRLAGAGIGVELVEPTIQELATLEPPLLTPLQFEARRLHMVTILAVPPWGDGVFMADPEVGLVSMTFAEFAKVYTGKVIRFYRE